MLVRKATAFLLPLLAASAASFMIARAPLEARSSTTLMSAERRDDVSSGKPSTVFERRNLLQTAASGAAGFLGVSFLLRSEPAYAGANVIIDELKVRESIKGIKDSVDALQLYEDFIKQKDLYGVKKALRVPPVSEIRRDCRRVIAGLEGPLKADSDKAYSQFIESLEKVDLIATRGIQSGKDLEGKEAEELSKTYGKMQVLLNDFVRLVSSKYGAE